MVTVIRKSAFDGPLRKTNIREYKNYSRNSLRNPYPQLTIRKQRRPKYITKKQRRPHLVVKKVQRRTYFPKVKRFAKSTYRYVKRHPYATAFDALTIATLLPAKAHLAGDAYRFLRLKGPRAAAESVAHGVKDLSTPIRKFYYRIPRSLSALTTTDFVGEFARPRTGDQLYKQFNQERLGNTFFAPKNNRFTRKSIRGKEEMIPRFFSTPEAARAVEKVY